jgi:hypothetical protein
MASSYLGNASCNKKPAAGCSGGVFALILKIVSSYPPICPDAHTGLAGSNTAQMSQKRAWAHYIEQIRRLQESKPARQGAGIGFTPGLCCKPMANQYFCRQKGTLRAL